jgi:hypothetical protein
MLSALCGALPLLFFGLVITSSITILEQPSSVLPNVPGHKEATRCLDGESTCVALLHWACITVL